MLIKAQSSRLSVGKQLLLSNRNWSSSLAENAGGNPLNMPGMHNKCHLHTYANEPVDWFTFAQGCLAGKAVAQLFQAAAVKQNQNKPTRFRSPANGKAIWLEFACLI